MRSFLPLLSWLIFLQVNSHSAFGQTIMAAENNTKEYKVVGNLYVQIASDLEEGSLPEWSFVKYNLEVPDLWELQSASAKSTIKVRLSESLGKVILITDNQYIAQIDIPADKLVLSSTPQTWNLIKFNSPLKAQGTITLSADKEGRIMGSFKLEWYTDENKLYTRITSDPFISTLVQKPKESLAAINGKKYYQLLDELMQLDYKRWDEYRGWDFGQKYVPGSLIDIEVKRDSANQQSEITARYKNTTGNTYKVTLLLIKETPYAIVDPYAASQTQWQMNCILANKKVNGQYVAYQGEEKENLQRLQRKYLFDTWLARFDKTPKKSNELKYLRPAEAVKLSSSTFQSFEREEMADKDGNPIGSISVPSTSRYTTSSYVPGIQNSSPDYILIRDFSWEQTDNTISIFDNSFWMGAGEIRHAFSVNPDVNNIDSMNFMIVRERSGKKTDASSTSRGLLRLEEVNELYSVYCSRENLVNIRELLVSRDFTYENGVFTNKYGDQYIFTGRRLYGTNNTLSKRMEYSVQINSAKFADSLLRVFKNSTQQLDDSTYTYTGQYLITISDRIIAGKKYKHFLFTNNSDGHRPIIAKRISSNKIKIDSRTTVSGIFVKAGDKITLTAEGKLKTAFDEDVFIKGEFGPEGNPKHGIPYNIAPYKPGALIGKIGPNGEWFLVGSSLVFTANTSGELILRVNDIKPEDNSGSFIVTYSIN